MPSSPLQNSIRSIGADRPSPAGGHIEMIVTKRPLACGGLLRLRWREFSSGVGRLLRWRRVWDLCLACRLHWHRAGLDCDSNRQRVWYTDRSRRRRARRGIRRTELPDCLCRLSTPGRQRQFKHLRHADFVCWDTSRRHPLHRRHRRHHYAGQQQQSRVRGPLWAASLG